MKTKKANLRFTMHTIFETTVELEVPDEWGEMTDGDKHKYVREKLMPNGVEADVLDVEDAVEVYKDGDHVNGLTKTIIDNLEDA